LRPAAPVTRPASLPSLRVTTVSTPTFPPAAAPAVPPGLDGRIKPLALLPLLGPDAPPQQWSLQQAQLYVHTLTTSHYENFSVLSSLVPPRLRPHFAAVYAFCRWADDLGDETGADAVARTRSLHLLSWWREELLRCFAGQVSHPVFIALRPTITQFALPIIPFDDLIRAFEQDQHVTRYQTWDELLGYCRLSANPVGRLVLMLSGERPPTDNAPSDDRQRTLFEMSDSICTALQLTNFWQDVLRDLLERDRIYLPAADSGVTEAHLRDWLNRSDDPAARIPYIRALRPLVDRTWDLFHAGEPLPARLSPEIRPVVALFSAGGQAVLRSVQAIGCATLWERPRLTKARKASLVLRAAAAAWWHRLTHSTTS